MLVTVEADHDEVGALTIAGSSSKTREETHLYPAAGDLNMFNLKSIGKIIENNEG